MVSAAAPQQKHTCLPELKFIAWALRPSRRELMREDPCVFPVLNLPLEEARRVRGEEWSEHRIVERIFARELLRLVPDRERYVLSRFMLDEAPVPAIASEMRVSPNRVYQLREAGLARLRRVCSDAT